MSHTSRMRTPIIHRKKLFDGRKTAEQVHRELAFGGPCTVCGGPPAVKVVILAPLADVMAKMPEYAAFRAAMSGGQIKTVDSLYGPLVRLTKSIFCDHCKAQGLREAAHPPKGWRDNLVVDIDYGIGADKPTVQVPAKELGK